MDSEGKKHLTFEGAFAIIKAEVKQKVAELGDYGSLDFNVKLEKHDGIITDLYLAQLVATKHFRQM